MSDSVRISRRSAKAILEMECPHEGHSLGRAFEELRAALRVKSKRSVKLARVRKESKRKTKRQETSAIRGAVLVRAKNQCEACGMQPTAGAPLAMDHFFGRVRVTQSERSCWMLCWTCHDQKTNNDPSSSYWLELFASWATKHGFTLEAGEARKRLQFVATRNLLTVSAP